MMVISFATYLFYAYAVIPLSYSGLLFLYAKRYQICPLVQCIGPLVTCVREPACRFVLDCLTDCDDGASTSDRRQQALRQFAHVPFPEDPALCRYQCFDQITTVTAARFIDCVGGSGCLEPAPPEYALPPMAQHSISKPLPFDTIQHVLAGSWKKLYTTGWDIWPCQSSEFHPPQSLQPVPLAWMVDWPTQSNVWRMDLRWWVRQNYTFHMTNNMYPGQQWDDFPLRQPVGAEATLKTRAIMWGTEAHENWYLLDYNETMQTILVYYVAYTMAVEKIDSITMVLRREDASLGPFTDEMAKTIEQKAVMLLGDEFGRLYRIEPCLL